MNEVEFQIIKSMAGARARKDWVDDIHDMHTHYGAREAVKNFDAGKLRKLLEFRANFIGEEYHELNDAIEVCDAEGVVDALIDICVVAIGTLDLFGVDAKRAWAEVHGPNMNKAVGVKANRPNPLGLPDLIKPDDWVGPDHTGNHGRLGEAFGD